MPSVIQYMSTLWLYVRRQNLMLISGVGVISVRGGRLSKLEYVPTIADIYMTSRFNSWEMLSDS